MDGTHHVAAWPLSKISEKIPEYSLCPGLLSPWLSLTPIIKPQCVFFCWQLTGIAIPAAGQTSPTNKIWVVGETLRPLSQVKKYWMERTWWESSGWLGTVPVVQDNNSNNGPWWWHNIGMSRWWSALILGQRERGNNGAEIYIYNINSSAGLCYRSSSTH